METYIIPRGWPESLDKTIEHLKEVLKKFPHAYILYVNDNWTKEKILDSVRESAVCGKIALGDDYLLADRAEKDYKDLTENILLYKPEAVIWLIGSHQSVTVLDHLSNGMHKKITTLLPLLPGQMLKVTSDHEVTKEE